MPNSVQSVFISYRRDDHSNTAYRIRDWFVIRYGAENVFMDFYSIPFFSDFLRFIMEKLEKSDVVVAIIGTEWESILSKKMESGEQDYLLAELEFAVKQGKLIAPICIEGATVPNSANLPIGLRSIFARQIASLSSDRHFDTDMEEIINSLESEFARTVKLVEPKFENTAISTQDEKLQVTINLRIEIGRGELTESEREAEKRSFYAGADKYVRNDFAGAIADYSQAIHLVPNFAWAFISRGAARRHMGDFEGALADYNQAIYLDDRIYEAFLNRGIAYHMLEDFDKAVDDFTQAGLIEPRSSAYSRRGTSHFRQGNVQQALADYAYAITLNSTLSDGI